jgi:hypothetical protein
VEKQGRLKLFLEDEYFIITFRTSHDAMAMERELEHRRIGVDLIPVPREISSECGFCLKVNQVDNIEDLEEMGIESLWKISGEDLMDRKYEQIS